MYGRPENARVIQNGVLVSTFSMSKEMTVHMYQIMMATRAWASGIESRGNNWKMFITAERC